MATTKTPIDNMSDHSSESKESILELGSGGVCSEDSHLIAMGKTPELKRVYNFWTLCGYQVVICSSWSCIVVLYGTIFSVGGPASLIYGSIIVAIGQTLMMASMAEYCGLWPTAGGQQYYIQKLASERWRPILSYLVGWTLLVAEIATSASCALNTADVIATFVGLLYPDFVWQPWMTYLLYLPLIILPLLLNLNARFLPTCSTIGMVLMVVSFSCWVIVMLVMAPKSSAEFVFTKFINMTGWSSNAWVFILSFYNPAYGLYGTDAMMHLVEEMKDASRDAPRAMIWSMVFAAVATLIADLVLLFCCGNYEAYLDSLAPYVAWFVDVTGNLYGTGVYIVVVFAIGNLIICTGVMSSASRLGWRMAHDGAFPWSHWLLKIHPKLGVPLNILNVILVIEVLMGLMVFGSSLAFEVIVASAGISFQLAYLIPILVTICRGRSVLPERPHFDLGRWGYLVNYLSVAWGIVICIVYVFPLYGPIDAGHLDYMNWGVLILGAEILFAGIYWVLRARHRYLKVGVVTV